MNKQVLITFLEIKTLKQTSNKTQIIVFSIIIITENDTSIKFK